MFTRISLKARAVIFLAAVLVAVGHVTVAQAPRPVMSSAVFDWAKVEVKPTKSGERRQFFQAPTATLDELECHVTTLNKGEVAHAPHQHPEEELIVVKEGIIEVVQGDVTNRVGAGSVVFHAANVMHGMRNVGDGVASYHVFKWVSPGQKRAAK